MVLQVGSVAWAPPTRCTWQGWSRGRILLCCNCNRNQNGWIWVIEISKKNWVPHVIVYVWSSGWDIWARLSNTLHAWVRFPGTAPSHLCPKWMNEIRLFFAKLFFMSRFTSFMNRFMPILSRFKRRVESVLNRFKTFRWTGSQPRVCEPRVWTDSNTKSVTLNRFKPPSEPVQQESFLVWILYIILQFSQEICLIVLKHFLSTFCVNW